MARNMGYQYETSPRKLEPEYSPVRKKAKKQSNKQQKNSKKYINEKLELKRKENRKKAKAFFYVGAVFAVLLVISYRNSKITEQFSEVKNLKSDLASIQKENEQLEVNIESSINLTNIEKEASEKLGMQKPTNEQKVYVSLPKKDYVQPTIEDNLKEKKNNNWVKAMINTVLGK
mgnify:CR=1 FL=1